MPNPPKPIVPNISTGATTGRVATDRYDFQAHIDGDDFRQKASTVDLFPTVVIGTEMTNVQDAIVALKNALTIPVLPDATSTVKGAVKLANDFAGTADLPVVAGLRGFPVAATPPTLNFVLQWNGSAWAPASISGAFALAGDVTGSAGANTVVQINGKPVSSALPTTNDGLIWNGTTWFPTRAVPFGTGFATTTSGGFDTNATANLRYIAGKLQTDSNIQYRNGGNTGDLAWLPTSVVTLTLPDATDTLVGRATTDILTSKTINATNNTITDTGILAGDILVSNGTKFLRRNQGAEGTFWGVSGGIVGYYAPPSASIGVAGTGFVTVTTGSVDPNATVNIRYTGGRLQTDFPIQWISAGITGDLAWSPTSSPKTLTLPDATDTLVGKSTTDVLINKTVNATDNSITDTSQAAGDLLKNNGSKFVRFARGSALQVLRVNAAGTDLEYATISSGGGSAGAVNTIQTSDGAGGFTAATNVLAGSGFISVGTTPATTGALRFPNSSSDVIMAIKDNGGTDRELISRIAINSVQIGPATTNAFSMTVTGNTIDLKPANQTRLYGTSGITALTVSGAGQVVMNPSNFSGFTIDTNVNTTGAIIQLFGGITGPGAGEFKYIGFGNSATPPTGTPVGGGYLYVETGALKYRGSSGTLTTVGPADPHCKKCGRDFMHEWQNDQYGKLASCMPCLLDALEGLGIDVNSFSDRQLNS
jgi:hypothetical protein